MILSFSTSSYIKLHHHQHQTLATLSDIRPNVHIDSITHRYGSKDKIIIIMGATGTGKSRLSIELATRFSPSEIINSDKMQVYSGLDITTNKIPINKRHGVPHHLLGEFDSDIGELTPSEFRSYASTAVAEISARSRLPLIVGGSNSFINALVSESFDSESDTFDCLRFISSELRYDCCFLWVDVGLPVLYEYLLRRVDDMFDAGMFQELVEFYKSETESYSELKSTQRIGIRKAIGVPEFYSYFHWFPPDDDSGSSSATASASASASPSGAGGTMIDTNLDKYLLRLMVFEEAVEAIKDNTCQLAKQQIRKILRLRSAGWNLHRINATEVFRAVLMSDSVVSSVIWEREVVEPSVKIVKRFLED